MSCSCVTNTHCISLSVKQCHSINSERHQIICIDIVLMWWIAQQSESCEKCSCLGCEDVAIAYMQNSCVLVMLMLWVTVCGLCKWFMWEVHVRDSRERFVDTRLKWLIEELLWCMSLHYLYTIQSHLDSNSEDIVRVQFHHWWDAHRWYYRVRLSLWNTLDQMLSSRVSCSQVCINIDCLLMLPSHMRISGYIPLKISYKAIKYFPSYLSDTPSQSLHNYNPQHSGVTLRSPCESESSLFSEQRPKRRL